MWMVPFSANLPSPDSLVKFGGVKGGGGPSFLPLFHWNQIERPPWKLHPVVASQCSFLSDIVTISGGGQNSRNIQ